VAGGARAAQPPRSSGHARISGVGDAQTADQNEFVAGNAAFIIRSSRASTFLTTAVGQAFDWQASSIPQRDAGKEPTTALYGPGLAAFRTDPDRQLAAWQLIKFLTSADTQATWVTSTGNLPVRRSVQDTALFADYQKKNPTSGTAVKLVPGARWEGSLGDQGIVVWLPQKLRNSMEDIEAGLLGGAIKPEAAQDQLQAQATQLFAGR
jgi:multiple sugar transport system substrate-binding protein